MRLNQEQDGIMNAISSNVETLAAGKDLVTGSVLLRRDIERIAHQTLNDINLLWGQIGHSVAPTLGYAPCPWNEQHMVGMVTEQNQAYVCCMHSGCPMSHTRMTMEEWNRRV